MSDLVSFRSLSMCVTIRPQHKLHLSSMEDKHLMARATNRTHSSEGFYLSSVCASIMKSSRRTCFAAGSSVFQAPPGLSLRHRASCATSCGLLGSSMECRKGHRSGTCSQQVAIEAVGTATSRDADQRDAGVTNPSTLRPRWKATAKRATDTHRARN